MAQIEATSRITVGRTSHGQEPGRVPRPAGQFRGSATSPETALDHHPAGEINTSEQGTGSVDGAMIRLHDSARFLKPGTGRSSAIWCSCP